MSQEILPAIKWEMSTAEALRIRIYNELEAATLNSFKLEQSFTRVGVLLSEFKAKEHWRQYAEYPTFEAFMDELRVRFHRGRTQLWGYLSVAENLLPTIEASKLEEMGISKALELKRAMKKLNGKEMPSALIESALQPGVTVKELRGTIGKTLNLTPEPAGTWFDLDGFFMDPEERAEFKEAFQATEGLLNLSKALPDHIRRKSVIMAWMQEWTGTHLAEFYGLENVSPTTQSEAVLVVRAPSAEVLRVPQDVTPEGEPRPRDLGTGPTDTSSSLQAEPASS
jgi:hypothetical protein